jgi:hypothetical protein
MENREFDFDEPVIFCSHNLDISNTKKLAKELAKRLGANINIMQGFDDEIKEAIKIPNAIITKNLIGLNPKYDKFFKYALEHGDEAHVIATEYLQYILPASVDYLKLIDDLRNIPENNADEDNSINELKKFGASEVYINNSNEINLTDEDKKDWSTVLEVLTKAKNQYCYKVV